MRWPKFREEPEGQPGQTQRSTALRGKNKRAGLFQVLPFCYSELMAVDSGLGWTVGAVCSGQTSNAHQEFADDLAAGEFEGLTEQFDPFLLTFLPLDVEPGGEGTMGGNDPLKPAGILDNGQNLQAITDNADIGQQTGDVGFAIGGDLTDVEVIEGIAQRLALL